MPPASDQRNRAFDEKPGFLTVIHNKNAAQIPQKPSIVILNAAQRNEESFNPQPQMIPAP
jgi:hypothetical protein